MRNFDRVFGDEFSYETGGRFTVLNAVYHHASDEALIRMAGASEDELRTWAAAQQSKKNPNRPVAKTPSWLRNLGWNDEHGKWHNVFWYH